MSRFLTHGEKVPLEKFLKFYFGLKHQKLTNAKIVVGWGEVGGGEIVSALVLKSMYLFNFQKSPFIPRFVLFSGIAFFAELLFYFPEVLFCYLELSFCFPEVLFCSLNYPSVFQKCHFFPKVSVYFSKIPIVFQICPLVFQKCLRFIYCARLF